MAAARLHKVPDGDPGAASALLGWGLQTILHAVGLTACETDVDMLGEHKQDTGVVDRARADVERMKREAIEEVGDQVTVSRFGPPFIRRVFEHCDQYRKH